jgi:hypothetical protein
MEVGDGVPDIRGSPSVEKGIRHGGIEIDGFAVSFHLLGLRPVLISLVAVPLSLLARREKVRMERRSTMLPAER